jgi:hypothetical protein
MELPAVHSVKVDPLRLSDHYCIVGRLDLLVPQNHTTVRRQRRCWRQFNFDRFCDDLAQSTLVHSKADDTSIDELFDLYDTTLRSLIDTHAPVKTVSIRTARTAPWYDTDCRAMKKETRRLEKHYRFEKLYRTNLCAVSKVQWQNQFKKQRMFFQQKLIDYWTSVIDDCRHDSKALWSKLRLQMTPPPPPNSSCFSADDFAQHFTAKVGKIRAATAAAPPPQIESRSVAATLSSFTPVTAVEVQRLLSQSTSKHCLLDPIPTWLLKRTADIVAPVLTVLSNMSMQLGVFPQLHKQAVVFPRLKKPTLDADDANSYRPNSNLTFISKFIERLVARRFVQHAEYHNLFPQNQSAYRRFHSTETAVISVTNDIIRSIDRGEITALVLLDLSSAFDTVDHQTLIDVLQKRFAVDGTALIWFQSYLTNRTQQFSVDEVLSSPALVSCSVPQGSVLGPLEFISYTEDVTEIFDRNSVHHHLFADDKQLYRSGKITEIDQIRKELCRCIVEVQQWCSSRRLQLNALKTELQWFGSRCNLRKIAAADLGLTVGDDIIKPVSLVRDLGVYLDDELSMKQHINRVVSSCFFQLRKLRQIRRSAGEEVTKRLVTALVLSRLDYCNAALAGLPQSTLRPLQRVQNAAARLVSNCNQREHITPVLKSLHWLPVKQRIIYKLCLIMHLIHIGHSPAYLRSIVQLTSTSAARPGLRSADKLSYRKPTLQTVFGERSFSYAGPAAWNSLPYHIKSNTNTTLFKTQLKTFLFLSAYPST